MGAALSDGHRELVMGPFAHLHQVAVLRMYLAGSFVLSQQVAGPSGGGGSCFSSLSRVT